MQWFSGLCVGGGYIRNTCRYRYKYMCCIYVCFKISFANIYKTSKILGTRDRKCGRSTRLMCNKQQYIVMCVGECASVPQTLDHCPVLSILPTVLCCC